MEYIEKIMKYKSFYNTRYLYFDTDSILRQGCLKFEDSKTKPKKKGQ